MCGFGRSRPKERPSRCLCPPPCRGGGGPSPKRRYCKINVIRFLKYAGIGERKSSTPSTAHTPGCGGVGWSWPICGITVIVFSSTPASVKGNQAARQGLHAPEGVGGGVVPEIGRASCRE